MNFKRPVITPLGLITITSAVTLVMLGAVLTIISTQNIDLKNLFHTFTQSAEENREQAKQQNAFRDIQVKNIEEDQQRTAKLLPAFMRSINDTAFVAKMLPELTANVSQVMQTLEEIKDLLNATTL